MVELLKSMNILHHVLHPSMFLKHWKLFTRQVKVISFLFKYMIIFLMKLTRRENENFPLSIVMSTRTIYSIDIDIDTLQNLL